MKHHATIVGWRPRTSQDSLNARMHWAKRAKRSQEAKERVGHALATAGWPRSLEHGGRDYVITLTIHQRVGKLMDSDNAAGCLKNTRDAIAGWLHVDDGQDGPEWVYRVRRGQDAVELELRRRDEREAVA